MKKSLLLGAVCTWLLAALVALPIASHAVSVTYNIDEGSGGLYLGTNQIENSGYFMAGGSKVSMSGSLTLDMADLASASGQITGTGDFGLGSDNWTLDFLGASSGTHLFVGGESDLLSIGYTLSSFGGHSSTGTFYFADRDFNGGTVSDGPNYIDSSSLYLWGNNWINANGGTSDRDAFVDAGGIALALDLAVPVPAAVWLFGSGLLGLIGMARRKKA